MTIDQNDLAYCESIYSTDEKLITINNDEIEEYLQHNYQGQQTNYHLLSNILIAIREIHKLADESNQNQIISLFRGDLTDESKYYYAYLLVTKSNLNPFIFLGNIEKTNFWAIETFFKDFFGVASKCDPTVIIDSIKNIVKLTNGNYAQNWIVTNINEYFNKNYELNLIVIENFKKTPDQYLQVIIPLLIENIVNREEDKASELIDDMLIQQDSIVAPTACFCCEYLIERHLPLAFNKLELIIKAYLSNKNEHYVSNACRFFISVLALDLETLDTATKTKIKNIIYENSENSDLIKYSIITSYNNN